MEEVLREILRSNQLLLKELKNLRSDLVEDKSDACTPKVALSILGLKNARLLTYFSEEVKLLTRQPGGSSFIYYKKELQILADRIKTGDVKVPKIRHLRPIQK